MYARLILTMFRKSSNRYLGPRAGHIRGNTATGKCDRAMGDSMSDDEYRAEAERLAALSSADRAEVIALHRAVANNPRAPKRERDQARERADALERHLRRFARK